jgi:protein TonB
VAAPRAPNTRPIYREQPDFPAEAARADITSGTVRARMSVDPSGRVVKVEILDARPRKVFDRAVMTALARWKFEPAGTPFTVDTQIDFKQD